jgi:hypothetical protein
MCYGGVDAKYMMRDIEERVKGVAFIADKSETPGQEPAGGLGVWLRAIFRWEKRKDLVNG